MHHNTSSSKASNYMSGSKQGIEIKRKNTSIVGNGAMKAKVPLISNFSKIS